MRPMSQDRSRQSADAQGGGKRSEALLRGHALMENHNGLLIDLLVSQATGSAEREAAKDMISVSGAKA